MKLSRASAVLFGLVYASEAFIAFYYNLAGNIVSVVQGQASSAPSFLNGWFSFWEAQVTAAPVFYAYLVGVLEAIIALALVLGFGRKVVYIGGAVFAVVAWGVGEGFGGLPVPGYTDPGTGIIQAIVFLILLGLNATHGTDPLTLDSRIETKYPGWKKIAEMSY
jgi:nitrite reductase (NO-forming)